MSSKNLRLLIIVMLVTFFLGACAYNEPESSTPTATATAPAAPHPTPLVVSSKPDPVKVQKACDGEEIEKVVPDYDGTPIDITFCMPSSVPPERVEAFRAASFFRLEDGRLVSTYRAPQSPIDCTKEPKRCDEVANN